MLIGEGLKERQALSCNPFGGASDCVTLPVTSTFSDTCGRSEVEVSPRPSAKELEMILGSRQHGRSLTQYPGLPQVDCIYDQEDAVDVSGDPAADLLTDMNNRCVAWHGGSRWVCVTCGMMNAGLKPHRLC